MFNLWVVPPSGLQFIYRLLTTAFKGGEEDEIDRGHAFQIQETTEFSLYEWPKLDATMRSGSEECVNDVFQ